MKEDTMRVVVTPAEAVALRELADGLHFTPAIPEMPWQKGCEQQWEEGCRQILGDEIVDAMLAWTKRSGQPTAMQIVFNR